MQDARFWCMETGKLTVELFMTPCPLTIGADQTIAVAHALMRRHQIRHLPVLSGGKIVGIVSLGDLHLIETLGDVSLEDVKVEEAMTPEPYCVAPESSLTEAARAMARDKYGCVVATRGNEVAGILTTVDVCRAFAELMGEPAAKAS